jgi:hypothetical protein
MSIAYFFNDFKQPIKILDIDYTPQLKSITLPVLVIWEGTMAFCRLRWPTRL